MLVEENIVTAIVKHIFCAYAVMFLEGDVVRKRFKTHITFKSLWYATFIN